MVTLLEGQSPGTALDFVKRVKGYEETDANWNKVILKNHPRCIVTVTELQCILCCFKPSLQTERSFLQTQPLSLENPIPAHQMQSGKEMECHKLPQLKLFLFVLFFRRLIQGGQECSRNPTLAKMILILPNLSLIITFCLPS